MTRNLDMFVGCSEISMSVPTCMCNILGLSGFFYLPSGAFQCMGEGLGGSGGGGAEKIAGL